MQGGSRHIPKISVGVSLQKLEPSAPELFRLGVARVSIGSHAMLATMGLVRKIARELRDHGTYEAMSQEVYRRAEAQALFASQARQSS